MYTKERSVQLVGSASMLTKNVSCLISKNTINLAVVHKSVVNVVTSALDGSSHTQNQVTSKEQSATSSTVIILQAKLVQMANRIVLVMCTQRGVQMFELDGAAMIYWHALEDTRDKNGASCHARGVCSVGNDTICVGTYQGQILVFNIPPKGTNIKVQETLQKPNGSAICDLASTAPKSFVSSNENGDITVWNYQSSYKPARQIPGYGYPCSCLCIWKDAVIGGYGSGHIRVFSMSSGQIVAEVTAHARWITSLDVTNNGLLMSTSDDTFVRVWQMKDGNPPTIEHKHSEPVHNLQLVGGSFTNPDGKGFCVAGYDSNEIIFYRS